MSSCSPPRLVVVLDRAGARLPIEAIASAAVMGGADIVQLREKTANPAEVEALLVGLIAAVGNPQRVAVNGHPDLATRHGCHLHLPESVRQRGARLALAPGACLSRAVHGAIDSTDADYVVLGNVFPTKSKPGQDGIGLERIAEIARSAETPILAIGGIEPERVGPVLSAGAFGVAVRSYVIGAEDPEGAARRIRQELDGWAS